MVPVIVVQILEQEPLEVILKANLEHLAEDNRQAKEIKVSLKSFDGREDDKNVINQVEENFAHQPKCAQDRGNKSILTRLEPLTDLSRNDYALNRGKVVAPLR